MTETLQKAPHDTEREVLQNYLAAIDRNPEKLKEFIEDLYHSHADNPHVLYAAATYLTSLTHLDHRTGTHEQPELPERQDAMKAFGSYTRLMAMLAQEKDAPRYQDDERVRRRLAGTMEELAFHAVLAYAAAQEGSDLVALPSPAELDFEGETLASDLQVFFPDRESDPTDIQVRYGLDEVEKYSPRIAVLNLTTVLGSIEQAGALRGLLKDVGRRPDELEGDIEVTPREHDVLMDAAADMLQAARNSRQE